MKLVVQYRWQVRWINKWVTTRWHSSEEDIRIEHPEAVPIEDTRLERWIPETQEEIDEQNLRLSTSAFRRGDGKG